MSGGVIEILIACIWQIVVHGLYPVVEKRKEKQMKKNLTYGRMVCCVPQHYTTLKP